MKLLKPAHTKTLVYQILMVCLLLGLSSKAHSRVKTESAQTNSSLLIKPKEAYKLSIDQADEISPTSFQPIKTFPNKTNTVVEFANQTSVSFIESNLAANQAENSVVFGATTTAESSAIYSFLEKLIYMLSPLLTVGFILLSIKLTSKFNNWLFHRPLNRNTVVLLVISLLFIIGLLFGAQL